LLPACARWRRRGCVGFCDQLSNCINNGDSIRYYDCSCDCDWNWLRFRLWFWIIHWNVVTLSFGNSEYLCFDVSYDDYVYLCLCICNRINNRLSLLHIQLYVVADSHLIRNNECIYGSASSDH
jgi:hypothetical protein